VAGGVLGLLLASLLCRGAGQALVGFDQLRHLSIQPELAVLCLGLAALIGVLSSITPAWSAARTPIVAAVRNAG
jgi:ABC-type antimicrobial peptide transport system permease subunit